MPTQGDYTCSWEATLYKIFVMNILMVVQMTESLPSAVRRSIQMEPPIDIKHEATMPSLEDTDDIPPVMCPPPP